MSNAKTLAASEQPSHANKQLLIDIDNASVQMGNELALDNVSVCVHAGEFIGIIGPNGAGKTTLLRLMLGLIRPDKGEVHRHPSRINYIPQHGALYNGLVPMSALEVVKLGSAGSADLALQALRAVHMETLTGRRFTDLSGGQRQRIAIAKALASQADILILDEPTAGIDEQSQAEFYDILSGLKRKGTTIILVAHEVDTVLKHVSRVVCLNRTLQYDGPPERFDADEHMPQTFLKKHEALHHGGRHA